MECPFCNSCDLSVVDTIRNRNAEKKVNYRTDLREHMCNNCGTLFPVNCQIAGVYVVDRDTQKKKLVSIDDFMNNYKPALGATRNDLKNQLFEEY